MSNRYTIDANTQKPLSFSGRFVFIESTTNSLFLSVTANTEFGVREFTVRSGGLIELSEVCSDWRFKNENSIDVQVVLHPNVDKYTEGRLVGDVNALTRFDNLTVDGISYFGGTQGNGVAGQYTCAFLFNPAASGVPIWLHSCKGSTSSGKGQFRRLTSVPAGAIDVTTLLAYEHSKIFGNANGVGKVYVYNNAAQPGTGIGDVPTDTANSITPFDLKNRPLKVPEGEGIAFSSAVLNTPAAAFFDWSEEE